MDEVRHPPAKEATLRDIERLAVGELDAVIVARRYRVERSLGRGGMASVFAAHDLELDRPVALKILSEDGCACAPQRARFLREARLHARVRHPNVVEVLDYGVSETGVIYLVMELLRGEDLGRTLARQRSLPWPRARTLMLEICAGLQAAHAVGVIHRDLKPANCFRVEDEARETIRLVDFGIATSVDESRNDRLTLREQIVGTPEYMSPEQALGEQVDHHSDIYAAGLLLGELLTGELPFRAATSTAMLAAQIYEPPPKLRSLLPPGVHVPAALETIYERALAKQPALRFANIDEFAAALQAIPSDDPLLLHNEGGHSSRSSLQPTTTRLGATTLSQRPPRGRWTIRPSWPLCVAAASLALLLGAVGALLLTSTLSLAFGTPTSCDGTEPHQKH